MTQKQFQPSGSFDDSEKNMEDISLNSPIQIDMKENNDLLKAILNSVQSLDKSFKKAKRKKSFGKKLNIKKGSEENEAVTGDLTSTNINLEADTQTTNEYQLGKALVSWVNLLYLVEQDSELLSILPLDITNVAVEGSCTAKDDDQAVKLVTLIASLAQWGKVVAIWEMLAERCKQHQRPANKNELYIITSAVNIHNLTWRNKKAELQSIDYPTAYNYKYHQRGNMTGETITAEWLPTLINPGATSALNALVYTQ